jgi:GABA(A) receptor-associated protein
MCSGHGTLSPFKIEWSLESRSKDCQTILTKHPQIVPMIVEKAAHSNVPELQKSKMLVSNTLTVAQVLRIIRSKTGLGRDSKLQLLLHGKVAEETDLISSVYTEARDEDGFLYCTYSIDQQSSNRSMGSEISCVSNTHSKDESFWSSWAPTSRYSWTPSGGWAVRASSPREAGSPRDTEMHQILSKKEQRARHRFQNRMRKRSAGPRNSIQFPEVVGNTNLANALASCKLDTALSGMIEVATKSVSSTSPGSSLSTYHHAMPCALRVHTATAAVRLQHKTQQT